VILTLAAFTAALSLVAGKPVTLTIIPGSPQQFASTADLGGTRIDIGEGALTDARHGNGPGLLIALHEVGHLTGISNEAQATCYGLARLRPFLRRYFHMGARRVERQFMDARAFMRTALGASYQCGSVR